METNYPSLAEIDALMKPTLEVLAKERITVVYDDPPTPPIRYRAVVREKGFSIERSNTTRMHPPRASPRFLAEHSNFVWDVHSYPSDGLKARYDRLRLGIEKGNRLVSELQEMNLIMIEKVKSGSPKGGRSQLVASLTPAGIEWLNSRETTA